MFSFDISGAIYVYGVICRYAVDVGRIRGRFVPWCQLLSVMVSRYTTDHQRVNYSAYHIFSWYKRSEFGIRAAVFFSAATVSGAFGGLLAVRRVV